jgi:DNA-binding NarL/FixJ family response regulator
VESLWVKTNQQRRNNMFDFTKEEYQDIIDKCMFNEEMSSILKMRIKGYSIVQISMELKLSESTVNRRIKQIKRKIKKVI